MQYWTHDPVPVRLSASTGLLERVPDVPTPEEKAVCDEATNLFDDRYQNRAFGDQNEATHTPRSCHVKPDVRTREAGESFDLQCRVVELESGPKHECLVPAVSVRIEDRGRDHREVL